MRPSHLISTAIEIHIVNDLEIGDILPDDSMTIPPFLYDTVLEYKNMCPQDVFGFCQHESTLSKVTLCFCGVITGSSGDDCIHIKHPFLKTGTKINFSLCLLQPITSFVIRSLDVDFTYIENPPKMVNALLQHVNSLYIGQVFKLLIPTPFGFSSIRLAVQNVSGTGMGCLSVGVPMKLTISQSFNNEKTKSVILKKQQILTSNALKPLHCEYCNSSCLGKNLAYHMREECTFRLVECEGCHLFYHKCYSSIHLQKCIFCKNQKELEKINQTISDTRTKEVECEHNGYPQTTKKEESVHVDQTETNKTQCKQNYENSSAYENMVLDGALDFDDYMKKRLDFIRGSDSSAVVDSFLAGSYEAK
ncbi:Uncharacterized protein QTN25_005131 [Entamoeba marina]